MKRYLLLLFTLLLVVDADAQAPVGDTVYWDKDWKITTKANHEYFRTSELDTVAMPPVRLIKIIDHYKNGNVQMDGYVLEADTSTLVGMHRWFTTNGDLNSVRLFDYQKARHHFESKAPYISKAPVCDSAKVDLYIDFFKRNKVKAISYLRSGKEFDTCVCNRICIYKEFDPIAKRMFYTWEIKNAKFDGFYRVFYSNGKLWEEGYYIDGKKTDWRKVYKYNGSVKKEKGIAPKQ